MTVFHNCGGERHPPYISLDFKAGVYNSEWCDDLTAIDGRYFLTHRHKRCKSSYLPKAQSFCQVQRQIRINRILHKARTRDDNGNLINEMNSVNLSMILFFSTILF